MPKFHIKPNEEAYRRMENGLLKIYTDPNLHQIYYGEFIYHYMAKYKTSKDKAEMALSLYLKDHLIRHMACRVGIENWPAEAILTWIRNYFGAKQLPHVITQAHDIVMKYQEQPKVDI